MAAVASSTDQSVELVSDALVSVELVSTPPLFCADGAAAVALADAGDGDGAGLATAGEAELGPVEALYGPQSAPVVPLPVQAVFLAHVTLHAAVRVLN